MRVVSHNQRGSFCSQLASDRHEANGCDGCMWNPGSTIGCVIKHTQLRCKRVELCHWLLVTCKRWICSQALPPPPHHQPHLPAFSLWGFAIGGCMWNPGSTMAVWSSIRSSDVKRVELCHWFVHIKVHTDILFGRLFLLPRPWPTTAAISRPKPSSSNLTHWYTLVSWWISPPVFGRRGLRLRTRLFESSRCNYYH